MGGTLVLHANVFAHGFQGTGEATTGVGRCIESVSAEFFLIDISPGIADLLFTCTVSSN